MEEKKLDDLPPVYSNLGYDAESGAGPSAPTDYDSSIFKDVPLESSLPTAPPAELKLGPSTMVYNPPALVFEDIYDACANYVSQNCCYGSRFINRMKLTEITNRGVYHYKLESFGEKRESTIVTAPYNGGGYDGPENGPEPNAWDIPVGAPHLFLDCGIKRDIPHTTTIHTCSECDGAGKLRCNSCSGNGRKRCWRCHGRGRKDDGRCFSCSGSGKVKCSRCSGTGRVTCSQCDGYGRVKKYKVLIVSWKNHPTDFVTNTDNFPQEIIHKTQGTTLFQKADFALQPITNAPEETVNAASDTMLKAHQRSFPSEMIIRQRHVLRAIPFTRVKYQWKEREGEFYVYGSERNVYFEEYPQRCCCCTCC